jgi:hypothetical protein
MENFSIWNPAEIGIDTCASWNLGRLRLWAERYEQEWHILPSYRDEEEASAPGFAVCGKADKPISDDWRHYLLRDGPWATPVPVMMDRPVILRPDRALVLLPGERARFFISLPVWFRLLVGKTAAAESNRQLQEFPIAPMANAWFGDPVSGKLCYFLAARLYPDFGQIPFSSVHAVCPLWISNESDRELSFDRICLHTEFLSIYRGESRLWTNEVSVVFRGPDHETRLQPSKLAPAHDGKTALVAGSRQLVEHWYFKKTFDLLKQFTGF